VQRLDQLVIQWDRETTVTLTVRVEGPRHRRGGPERRLEELIAGELWLAAQGIEAPRTEGRAPTS
jgi:hypothetical protein